MGYRTQVNVTTNTFNTTTTYTEPFAGNVMAGFGIYAGAQALKLSIGHVVPTDATSVDVLAGESFSLAHGVIGPVFIKAAAAETISVYWG